MRYDFPLFLLARNGLGLAFARARVGVGALPADWQLPAVPKPAIAAKVHQPLDMGRNFPAKIAFDHVIAVNCLANLQHLRVCEFVHAALRGNIDPRANFLGFRRTDAVNISQRDDDPLVGWNIDARDTSQCPNLHSPQR
jgi:hypothetical protein